ncbi:MAG: cyclin-dependent kinase inhibitor 3 family protein [Betaproteobacteria bacterium]
MDKTSDSHPLRIDSIIPLVAHAGTIGMSFCPGKTVIGAFSGGNWVRDLDIDLSVIKDWQATEVLTLLEAWELAEMRVDNLGRRVQELGMTWNWLEIPDGGIPQGDVADKWHAIRNDLIKRIAQGESIFIHCKGGLGRTGTLATELLLCFGEDLDSAMKRVRLARPGTIETPEQEKYLRGIACNAL